MERETLLNSVIKTGLGMGSSWNELILDATKHPDLGIESFYTFANNTLLDDKKIFDCYKIIYYGRRQITKKIPKTLNHYIDILLQK
jgi:hypothetical protein